MSIDNLFASRLRQAMTLRGVKQVDLCAQTGIPKSALSQYLRGAFEPKQDRLWALAKALGVSEAWLMGYDVAMERAEAAPAGWTDGEDPLADQLFAAYGEVKDVITQENIDDVKLFLSMIAERERQKKAHD